MKTIFGAIGLSLVAMAAMAQDKIIPLRNAALGEPVAQILDTTGTTANLVASTAGEALAEISVNGEVTIYWDAVERKAEQKNDKSQDWVYARLLICARHENECRGAAK